MKKHLIYIIALFLTNSINSQVTIRWSGVYVRQVEIEADRGGCSNLIYVVEPFKAISPDTTYPLKSNNCGFMVFDANRSYLGKFCPGYITTRCDTGSYNAYAMKALDADTNKWTYALFRSKNDTAPIALSYLRLNYIDSLVFQWFDNRIGGWKDVFTTDTIRSSSFLQGTSKDTFDIFGNGSGYGVRDILEFRVRKTPSKKHQKKKKSKSGIQNQNVQQEYTLVIDQNSIYFKNREEDIAQNGICEIYTVLGKRVGVFKVVNGKVNLPYKFCTGQKLYIIKANLERKNGSDNYLVKKVIFQ